MEFVSIVSQPSFCLCLFYRPPSSPVSVFDNLCTTLQIVNPADFSSFLLIGDFNVKFCNTDHFLFSHVQDIMLSFSLTQVVSSHTYISPSGTPSLLDLAMLTNTEQLQAGTTIPPLSTSDQYGVSLTLEGKIKAATSCKSRRVWFYCQGDYDKACRLIEEMDWNCILTDVNISRAATNFTEKFLTIMEDCIPHCHLRKRCNLPWLTKSIIQLIRRRNLFFKKTKKSMSEVYIQKYKRLRNKIVSLLRNKKKEYFNTLTTAGNKEFWKTIKLLNQNRDTIPALQYHDCTVSQDSEKAWNSHYQRIIIIVLIYQSMK